MIMEIMNKKNIYSSPNQSNEQKVLCIFPQGFLIHSDSLGAVSAPHTSQQWQGIYIKLGVVGQAKPLPIAKGWEQGK